MPGAIDPLVPTPAPAASGPLRPQGANRRHASATGGDTHLKAACQEMEALFIHRLLTEMRKSVVKSGLIDGGRAEEIYTSLMDAETAKHISQSGGLGLSAMLLEQLGRRTAADPAPAGDPSASVSSFRDRRRP